MSYVKPARPTKAYKKARLRPQIKGVCEAFLQGKMKREQFDSFRTECRNAGITDSEFSARGIH